MGKFAIPIPSEDAMVSKGSEEREGDGGGDGEDAGGNGRTTLKLGRPLAGRVKP